MPLSSLLFTFFTVFSVFTVLSYFNTFDVFVLFYGLTKNRKNVHWRTILKNLKRRLKIETFKTYYENNLKILIS